MLDESSADRWLAIAEREESILRDLVEVLQSDQRAVASADADGIEENTRRKEAALAEMRLLEESRKGFLASLPGAGNDFSALAGAFPPSRREAAEARLCRLRSLRGAVAELNDLSLRIMIHGLFLVRSAMGVMTQDTEDAGYCGKGALRSRTSTGRIVRRNV